MASTDSITCPIGRCPPSGDCTLLSSFAADVRHMTAAGTDKPKWDALVSFAGNAGTRPDFEDWTRKDHQKSTLYIIARNTSAYLGQIEGEDRDLETARINLKLHGKQYLRWRTRDLKKTLDDIFTGTNDETLDDATLVMIDAKSQELVDEITKQYAGPVVTEDDN